MLTDKNDRSQFCTREKNALWAVRFASNNIVKISNSHEPSERHGEDMNIICKFQNIVSSTEKGPDSAVE